MAAAIPSLDAGEATHTGPMPAYAFSPSRRYGMRCPHCKTPAQIRSSGEQAPTLCLIYFSCPNPVCGHTWRASLVYDFGLSPSAIPDPALDLKMNPIKRAEALRAMADAAARNDPDQPTLFDTPLSKDAADDAAHS